MKIHQNIIQVIRYIDINKWIIKNFRTKLSLFVSAAEEVDSPTDLQFFEVSDKKIVLTWTGPSGDVSGYRVTVVPIDESGSPQREMTLPVSQNSYIEVSHLEPGTLYRFNIYTIHNGEESLPLIGEQTTSECARKWLFPWKICFFKNDFLQVDVHFTVKWIEFWCKFRMQSWYFFVCFGKQFP